jgi:hypothetical protein
MTGSAVAIEDRDHRVPEAYPGGFLTWSERGRHGRWGVASCPSEEDE